MWSGSTTDFSGGYSNIISQYITKTIPFKFRGIDFTFGLSQGLFSSADVDNGTRLLLKVFSRVLDDYSVSGRSLPQTMLDAGCGAGVIGICAATAVRAMGGEVQMRCQDRDELARIVTMYNAAMNHIPVTMLEAFTEPLLAGPSGSRWDIILTNIPAKAGTPVLEDFVRRSGCLLNDNGKVILVAVYTLADFFRQTIIESGAQIYSEEKGSGHTVFVYGRDAAYMGAAACDTQKYLPLKADSGFLANYPFYRRAAVDFNTADVQMQIETVHGASGFDTQNAAEQTVVALLEKIPSRLPTPQRGITAPPLPTLIHEGGQGFFACWLYTFLKNLFQDNITQGVGNTKDLLLPFVFSGRNILTLEAARHNYNKIPGALCQIQAAADLESGAEDLLAAAAHICSNDANAQYRIIIAFPELLPQSLLPKTVDQLAYIWDSIPALLCPGGIFAAGFKSTDAERFDRKKPAGFTRLGDIKRNGFRALAYARNTN